MEQMFRSFVNSAKSESKLHKKSEEKEIAVNKIIIPLDRTFRVKIKNNKVRHTHTNTHS